MKFSVFDVDRHKRHNIIGHALYQLKEHETETNDRLVVWRDLEREVAEVCNVEVNRNSTEVFSNVMYLKQR